MGKYDHGQLGAQAELSKGGLPISDTWQMGLSEGFSGRFCNEEPEGKSRDCAECMTCTLYATVSGISGYCTQMIDRGR